jgi:hypothetical protein
MHRDLSLNRKATSPPSQAMAPCLGLNPTSTGPPSLCRNSAWSQQEFTERSCRVGSNSLRQYSPRWCCRRRLPPAGRCYCTGWRTGSRRERSSQRDTTFGSQRRHLGPRSATVHLGLAGADHVIVKIRRRASSKTRRPSTPPHVPAAYCHASALMTSPPLIVFRPSQTGMLMLFLTNRTEPSPSKRLIPPGWRLREPA